MKKHLTIALCCLALVAFLAGGAVAEDKKPAAPTAPAKEEAAPVKDGKACEPKPGCDPAKCPGHAKDQAQSHEGCKAAPAKDQAGCCKGAAGKDQAGCAKAAPAKDQAGCTKAAPAKDQAGCTKAAPAKDQAGCTKGAAGCAKACPSKDAKASPSEVGSTSKTK